MTYEILHGDCIEMLDLCVPDKSVQMCVTSPPYFGLRDYGVDGQIGLEQTPAQFVSALVSVFREVRRVLRDDGTLWLNLGDSYVNKQLQMMPAQVALALQADGWYLRQDIIWAKPNPMPESTTDRCTKAHEYLFLLSKSRTYLFDSDAIKEPANLTGKGNAKTFRGGAYTNNSTFDNAEGGNRTVSGNEQPKGRLAGNVNPPKGQIAYEAGDEKQRTKAGLLASAEKAREAGGYFTRNKRSVWNVATRGYKGAHFATFPPALIEPCILAGSKPGDLVLDPFMGSGTTAQVALQHGRRALGCELNSEYIDLTHARMAGVVSQANQ